MNEIVLIGAGGHAKSCIDVIEQENKYKIVGLIDNRVDIDSTLMGYPIVGNDKDLPEIRKKINNALITVGQIKTSKIRQDIFSLLTDLDFNLPVIISPSSYISRRSIIKKGTIVMNGVIINSNSKIGKNCIINNKVLIEHDTEIKKHCHISTGAILNGGVVVGEGSFIGSNSTVKEYVNISNNSVVGMSSIVVKNIIN